MIKRRKLKQLAWREYVPLAGIIAMWAVVVLAIGHADAARLLAATIMVRAIHRLNRLATVPSLKWRIKAPSAIRRQAYRFAFTLQAGNLVLTLVLVVLLAEAMKAIGQHQIAAFLPFIALGLPARNLRQTDIRSVSPYNGLALAIGGLAMVSLGWIAGWQAAAISFAFGAREWIAFATVRFWPRDPQPSKVQINEPLRFEEVARYSAVLGRRLLTYRLTKTLLTVFGPLGNIAARTGRGLNWHRKLEPYVPHHLGGFILFSGAAFAGAVFLAVRSGEPAAMIGAAGLFQIGAVAANVVLLWRWLPAKGAEVIYDDDDDE